MIRMRPQETRGHAQGKAIEVSLSSQFPLPEHFRTPKTTQIGYCRMISLDL